MMYYVYFYCYCYVIGVLGDVVVVIVQVFVLVFFYQLVEVIGVGGVEYFYGVVIWGYCGDFCVRYLVQVWVLYGGLLWWCVVVVQGLVIDFDCVFDCIGGW